MVGFTLVTAGCGLVHRVVTPPAATVTLAGGAGLTQTGDAQTPAKVTSDTTVSTVPVPAGSTVIVDEKKPGVISVLLAGQSEIKTQARKETAEAPQAFKPAAPPTPSEEADGKATLYYRIGVALGIAVGAFGLVRGWDLMMYGGGIVAAACLAALFFQKHPVITALIGAGVAVAVVGPILWHTKLKHLEKT